MDISSASAGYDLQQSFGNTKEGKWLKANAHKYGFIIRYGKDQEKLTGYSMSLGMSVMLVSISLARLLARSSHWSNIWNEQNKPILFYAQLTSSFASVYPENGHTRPFSN